MSSDLSAAKRRLVELLKCQGPKRATELADELELTDAAVRQHLTALQDLGIVESGLEQPDGRGRPASIWKLTGEAAALFPDRHAHLTVDLIDTIRTELGQSALDRIIDAHAQQQVGTYGGLVDQAATVRKRVNALARQRSAEGYMAEATADGDGSFLLVENHCPICDAAAACTGLCRAELDVFQDVLGPDVEVERTEHLLSGGERCVYRVTPVAAPARRGS